MVNVHPVGKFQGAASTLVVRLAGTIYGLKQSSRKWYKKLTGNLGKLGIHPLHSDHTVYRVVRGNRFAIMAIHIDDSTLTGNSPELIDEIQQEITCMFKITKLGIIS
jgi:hypothetical protein